MKRVFDIFLGCLAVLILFVPLTVSQVLKGLLTCSPKAHQTFFHSEFF